MTMELTKGQKFSFPNKKRLQIIRIENQSVYLTDMDNESEHEHIYSESSLKALVLGRIARVI